MFVEISRQPNRHPEQTYQPQWHEPENVLMRGLRSVYNQIPTNLRMVGQYVTGYGGPFTEKDFAPEELQAMRRQYEETKALNTDRYAKALSKLNRLTVENAPQFDPPAALGGATPQEIYDSLRQRLTNEIETYERRMAQHRTPVSKYGAGGDVNEQSWGNVLSGMFDPAQQVGTTVGKYNVLNTPQGDMVYDLYNFDKQGYEKEEPFSLEYLTHPVKGVDWALRKYGPQHSVPVQIMLPK